MPIRPDPVLQREYDNRAMVPEHPAIIAGWQRESAAWRGAAPRVECDLPYGAGERERLDLFWPAAARAAPIAMFIHGGYWQAMDRRSFGFCARGMNEAGMAVAVPSYDLCPAVPVATIVAQMRAAAGYLWRRYGRTLVASGHSAGGQLAALLLATDWPRFGLPKALVRMAVPISGVFDLTPLPYTNIGDALRLDEAAARAVSPMFMAAPGRPVAAFVGGAESAAFRHQTRDFAAAWGGKATELPGLNHFTVLDELTDPGSALVRAIATGG